MADDNEMGTGNTSSEFNNCTLICFGRQAAHTIHIVKGRCICRLQSKTGIDFVAGLNQQKFCVCAKVTTLDVKLLCKKIVIYEMAKEILEKDISWLTNL